MSVVQRKLGAGPRPEAKAGSRETVSFPEGAVADARILCCPVAPHPVAMDALEKYAPAADIVPLEQDDIFGYWREIKARWTGEQDLIIVEQDIEIDEDTIQSLADCPEPWCAFAYNIFRRKIRLSTGLGCTKISAATQQKINARLIAEGFELCAKCKGQGCWWHLDGRITGLLKHAGFLPHVHGDVAHHHDYHAMSLEHPKHGVPVEMFFEEDSDPSAPARVVMTDLPPGPACSSRQVQHHASELIRMAEQLAGNPDLASFVSQRAPGPPQAFDTDKVSQGYMGVYHEIAEQLGSTARVCEIGVLDGGSLATWQELFPQGTVAGVDVNPAALWPDSTIRIVASQDDPALPDLLSAHEYEWDLIVDDASHDGLLSAATLDLLWPLVSPGGYYIIEDWFVGYSDYHGACKSPQMLELVKNLLDRLHSDGDVSNIGYQYGMAIMRKKT